MCLVLDTTAASGGWIRISSWPRVCMQTYSSKPGGLGPLVPRSILPSDSVCTAAVCCHGIRQSTCLAGSNAFESDRKGAIVSIVWNILYLQLSFATTDTRRMNSFEVC